MRAVAVSLLFVLLVVSLSAGVAFSAEKVKIDAKALFISSKCTNCHSITSQSIEKSSTSNSAISKKAPDLSETGSKSDVEFIEKWLKKEEKINDKKHVTAFKGTEEELKALSAWLATMKKDTKKTKTKE